MDVPIVIAIVCIAGLAGLLLLGYVLCLLDQRWPPGHPWSGLSFGLLLFLHLRYFPERIERWNLATGGVALLAAAFWVVSVFEARRRAAASGSE